MPKPPRRPYFQIHLSTAIVLMFVAGTLIWANTFPRTQIMTFSHMTWYEIDKDEAEDVLKNRRKGYILKESYGWPTAWLEMAYGLRPKDMKWNKTKEQEIWDEDGWLFTSDLLVAMIILFAIWFVVELLIRRRSSKKGP